MEATDDKYANIDVTKVYEYRDLPDKISSRCDNCGSVKFKSSVGAGKLLRECTNCEMKKNI
ncbi:hypothetical protein [Priestia aryabhattai]|uniref:DUF8096 domain-containing protein n=1 Tax=Priestia aryabhattai TaxID=412384 RepID=A0ABD7X2H3_PRIAR|nr:hypothetical protein [Priestia aryabhattai]WEA46788.1 hypothetical protein PWO00_12750 [Priestia aryabhattai]